LGTGRRREREMIIMDYPETNELEKLDAYPLMP